MGKLLCISADSHVVEPPEMFAPLEQMFGDRGPRVVTLDPAQGPQLDLRNGTRGFAIAGFLQQNVDFFSPESRDMARLGYELARPGCYNIAARLREQDEDGIDAEVLYPSVLFHVYQLKDLDILKAAFGLYNDWVADYSSGAPDRLFPLAAIQLYDLDAAIAEMRRCKDLGHVGVCIPATAPPDRLYADRWYDPFWAAAQEMEMPLTMHIFTGATPDHGLAPRASISRANGAVSFAGVGMTVADLIQSGVCERFPRLKFVVTEFETGWIGSVLKKMDWNYIRFGGARASGLPMLPSHYWQRNFSATYEDDPLGIMTREFIGTGTLQWGNDYPHGDSIFPHSMQVLSEILADCTPEERYQMTVKNVVELFNLPFTLEGPEQARVNSLSTPVVKTWRNSLPSLAMVAPE